MKLVSKDEIQQRLSQSAHGLYWVVRLLEDDKEDKALETLCEIILTLCQISETIDLDINVEDRREVYIHGRSIKGLQSDCKSTEQSF